MSKFSEKVIGFPTPLEMANANPLDSRFVVTELADLTNVGGGTPWLIKDEYTNVYPGMQVYVTAEKTTYMYVGDAVGDNKSSVADSKNWVKTSDSKLSSDKLLTNINVNSKDGNVSNHVASVTLEGNDISLGSNYDGEIISGLTDGTLPITPTSADTINESFKKIVKIIGDDELVISAAANDLNDRLKDISGKSITELTSTNQTVVLTKKVASDGTISYDLSTSSDKIDTSSLNLGLHYEKKSGSTAPTISLSNTKGETVDASDFIIDGMMKNVALDDDAKNLVFTWNEDGGSKTVEIPLSSLSNIYDFYTGDTSNNVAFSTDEALIDGTKIVKGDVKYFDCGMYDDSSDPT